MKNNFILLFCFLLIVFIISCSSVFFSRKTIVGLYREKHMVEGPSFASYMLFKKGGVVKYLSKRGIDRHEKVRKDIEKNGCVGKYELKNDSIFFHFDSINTGVKTISFTAFGKHHEECSYTYVRVSQKFRGVMKGDSLYLKSIQTRPEKTTSGNWTILPTDTVVTDFESFFKCN